MLDNMFPIEEQDGEDDPKSTRSSLSSTIKIINLASNSTGPMITQDDNTVTLDTGAGCYFVVVIEEVQQSVTDAYLRTPGQGNGTEDGGWERI